MREESEEPDLRWRTADAADLPFIQVAELDYIRAHEPDQEAAWLAVVDRNRQLWAENLERTTVAEVGGTPVGYGMWAVLEGVATVVTLHVAPAHRRSGLGRRLLDTVGDDARRSGHDVLALGVHRENPARHLYESAGFTLTGEDGDYLLFRRDLDG
ncbi:Ribosomal protein S18 acetylase RimI [Blastococcus aggregatus]|uniref:Ribosomal protein S18 acetylase RimI n=1 Tax=Blastococcus aggregatus TaxID=38502 RepID=A0A285UY26_9ACTN|nr:GNAT family N-acetyltransferase [Blastococcus aggregatus]SOC46719.1 Ribosomal protein S18 acetylase RimI [Blastococcus aggregatus]